MKTVLARNAGFCFGVKRALELATKTADEKNKNIHTLGPLIHNPQVVDDLSNKGIGVAKDIDQIPEGVIIIRSHGVGPEVFEKASQKQLSVVDATCPFVKKAHMLAKELSEKGYQVVVVGDKEHPEVTGILGWTKNHGIVIQSPQEAKEFQFEDKIGVISQTTQQEKNFQEIVDVLKAKVSEVKAYNTICHATRDRQSAAIELAKNVEAMIVIGGKNSANTQKLARLCVETGTPTYHIETKDELDKNWFTGMSKVGITAGASTPDWIIKEVVEEMEELSMNEFNLDEFGFKEFKRGEVVKGIVVQVNDDELMVDIGGKSEGVIPLRELACGEIKDPRDLYKNGDEIEAVIISNRDDEGRILLSKRKADAEKAWVVLEKAMEEKTPVEGTIFEVVKGGVLVDVGLQAFMPASLVDTEYVDDLNKFVGQKIKAMIIEFNRESRKVVLSRKEILQEEKSKKKEALWQDLQEGMVVKGIVKRLANFGAFVDIGGVDGLLHVSEMAWYRVTHPSEILKENDEIEVFVLSADKATGKVSLSLKKILPNPWQNIEEKYKKGEVVTGKVVRTAPFGAFVELEQGVDGLIHISQLSDKRVNAPTDVVKPGDEVKAKVVEVDVEHRKISLSIKELLLAEKEEETKSEFEEYKQKEQDTNPTLGDQVGTDVFNKLNQ